MSASPSYFFCGVGGSGMAPLALIVKARGAEVAGSDRSLDQGLGGPRFDFLRDRGVALFPQDGSGPRAGETLVVSAAIEDTIPDVGAAKRLGLPIVTRARLLADLFNAAKTPVGVAGTSGKSTVTGMIGWILAATGRDPTIMNGADMKAFSRPDAPFAGAVVGTGDAFVSEVDESDGSIALYRPRVAVVNNVTLDHKSMDELRVLFGDFVSKAEVAVLNLDDPESAALIAGAGSKAVTYSLSDGHADLLATDLVPGQWDIGFTLRTRDGESHPVALKVPGRHNVANALAALAAARACGVPLNRACAAISGFTGIRRRMDVVGEAGGVTVIDDFGHNPDKIAATLDTLHAFPGRLLVMFQPHGYGPLRLMKDEFIAGFAAGLDPGDVLILPDPVYRGGTTDRSVSSDAITGALAARGLDARHIPDRSAIVPLLADLARPGDRIVVMGARDDTLSVFAREVLERLG